MKYEKIKIPIYEWELNYYEIECQEDAAKFAAHIKKGKRYDNELIETIHSDVTDGKIDGAWTSTLFCSRKSFIIVYPCTDDKSRRTAIMHEKRHVEDHILTHFSVDDMESSALLAGYLGEKLYKFL